MYTSNELIVLKNTATGEINRILPNTEFELPAGDYINLNEARLCKDGKTALVIKAGETITGSKAVGKKRKVGTKVKDLKPTEARQVLREESKSFPVQEPVKTLLEADDD
jgi:hypothetical protein